MPDRVCSHFDPQGNVHVRRKTIEAFQDPKPGAEAAAAVAKEQVQRWWVGVRCVYFGAGSLALVVRLGRQSQSRPQKEKGQEEG